MTQSEQEVVEALLEESRLFRELHEQHRVLKAQIREAELGTLPMDDLTLHRLKKEKLRIKDRMAEMVRAYRRSSTA
ncbi:YdcH family protein [Inmirania thermothiophila]|uniref:DUF465 domain-containing protein n=1 Tax=Inmirania thermothiophila TaxID=1750597 RepID=A0A3N1Y2X8_9GAMM|nr:YdcH family protein [Inmirania thermothiophila]ROR32858.1 hypothetical protein EDC57_2072 [Inmirania thermothiophila]